MKWKHDMIKNMSNSTSTRKEMRTQVKLKNQRGYQCRNGSNQRWQFGSTLQKKEEC